MEKVFLKMNELCTQKWQWFQIKDVFTIKRGKRNKSTNRTKGNVEYYSASNKNNGLTDMISNPLFTDENKIIFSTLGDCFYIANKFTASDVVAILELKKRSLNKSIALFLVSILRKLTSKYNYGRQAYENRLKHDYIKLPIDNYGNLDFQFMSNYIKNISKKIKKQQPIIFFNKKNYKMNDNNYSEYQIKEIFQIEKGERLIKNDRIAGTIPLVTASSKNNGVVDFLDLEIYKDRKKLFSNVITIDMFFNVFYQQDHFFADDNIHCLTFKNNFKLTKEIAFFLVTILRQIKIKYDFGRQLRIKRLENESIKLPIDADQELHTEFMKNYITSLYYYN